MYVCNIKNQKSPTNIMLYVYLLIFLPTYIYIYLYLYTSAAHMDLDVKVFFSLSLEEFVLENGMILYMKFLERWLLDSD